MCLFPFEHFKETKIKSVIQVQFHFRRDADDPSTILKHAPCNETRLFQQLLADLWIDWLVHEQETIRDPVE